MNSYYPRSRHCYMLPKAGKAEQPPPKLMKKRKMRWRKYYATTHNLVIELFEENTLARQLRDFSMSPKAPALLNQYVFLSSRQSPMVQRIVGIGANSRP